MSPVAVALDGSGARVLSLTLRTPTLDDVFLQLTGAHLQADEANTDGGVLPGGGTDAVDGDGSLPAAAGTRAAGGRP
jgi:hypothetical protein